MANNARKASRDEADRPEVGLPREMVKPAILLLLKERRAHGYGLVDQLGNLGLPIRDPGAVYRVLRGLEDSNLVRSKWEARSAGPARRVYQITARGEQELASWGSALERQHLLISGYLRRYRESVNGRGKGSRRDKSG